MAKITCTDYTYDGKGIGHLAGRPVFASYFLLEEEGEVHLIHRAKNYDVATVKVANPSTRRGKSPCELFKQCGGCHLYHMNYPAQLEFKRLVVANALKSILGQDLYVHPVIPSPDTLHYRNKVQIPLTVTDKGVVAGYYALNSHRIVPQRKCYLHPEAFNDIIQTTLKILNELKILDARHLHLRQGDSIAMTLVVPSLSFPQKKEFAQAIRAQLPEVATLILNENSADTNVVLGNQEEILFGEYITTKLLNITFTLAPRSFFQVNKGQMEQLITLIKESGILQSSDTLLDCYCGIGALGLSLADRVRKVIAIDNVAAAIANGRESARKNNIANIKFILSDVLKADLPPSQVAIIDPPRKGCQALFLEHLMTMGPRSIIYISCNPGSLARDLKILNQHYEITQITPFDMFPQTYHVETVVFLSRRELKYGE